MGANEGIPDDFYKAIFILQRKDVDDEPTTNVKRFKHYFALFVGLCGCFIKSGMMMSIFMGTWRKYGYSYFIIFALTQLLVFVLVHVLGICLLKKFSKPLVDRDGIVKQTIKEYCVHFFHKYGISLILDIYFTLLRSNRQDFPFIYTVLLIPLLLMIICYLIQTKRDRNNSSELVNRPWFSDRTSIHPSYKSMSAFFVQHLLSCFVMGGIISTYCRVQGEVLQSSPCLIATHRVFLFSAGFDLIGVACVCCIYGE